MSWERIEEKKPYDGQIIVYAAGSLLWTAAGRYFENDNPMPSAPYWLPWTNVTHWMPLPEIPITSESSV